MKYSLYLLEQPSSLASHVGPMKSLSLSPVTATSLYDHIYHILMTHICIL